MSFPGGKRMWEATLDQRPIPGHEPLARPTADVARAYLDEVGAIEHRREAVIDRRRMAQLACAEALILAVYLTVMMFGFGNASVSSSFILLVALLLLWIQFSNELKESLGGQPRMSGTAQRNYLVFGLLVVVAVMVGVGLQIAGVEIPVGARFMPGAVLLLIFGRRTLRDLRSASPALPRERDPITTGARYATAALGALIGAAVWAAASETGAFSSIVALCVMLLMLGWGFAVYVSGRLPALGAIWRWPQWTAFALGSGALIAATFVTVPSGAFTSALVVAVAVCIAALFVAVAFIGGRDDR